jgi:hypothetical protein
VVWWEDGVEEMECCGLVVWEVGAGDVDVLLGGDDDVVVIGEIGLSGLNIRGGLVRVDFEDY